MDNDNSKVTSSSKVSDLIKYYSNSPSASKKDNTGQPSIAAPSTPSATTNINSNGIPLIGVSLRWFINFIETDEKVNIILKEKGDKAIMDDLLSVVRNMTSEVDESFAEMLLRTQPDKKLTKPTADVFISYARLYLVNDMIPAIKILLPTNGESEDIYVWLDSLSINQRVKSEFDPDFFIKTLKQGIETISNVAVVLTPWDNPGNLTRAWCIWELYSAVESKGVNIQVLIPPTQRIPFRKALYHDFQTLMTRIGKIDIEKAQAWSAKDRDMILDAARKSRGGIQGVRESVIQPLRDWMMNETKKMVNDNLMFKGTENYDPKYHADVSTFAGILFASFGKFNEAEPFMKQAVYIYKELHNSDHVDIAGSLGNLGELYSKQKKYEEAENVLSESLKMKYRIFGDDHPDIASNLHSISSLMLAQGKLEEAEKYCQKAIDMKKKIHGDNHPNLATSLNCMSGILKSQGNIIEAEVLCTEALIIYKNNFGDTHALVALGLGNLSSIKKNLGKLDEAETMLRDSCSIYEKIYGNKHPEYLIFYKSLIDLLNEKERLKNETPSQDIANSLAKSI